METLTDQVQFLNASGQKIDSLQSAFFHSTDSLKEQYHGRLTRIDSTQRRLESTLSNVNSFQVSLRNSVYANGPDSTQRKWKSRIDSLTLLNEYSAKVLSVLDSVHVLHEKTLSELSTKIQSLKEKTVKKLVTLNLPPQLSDKAGDVSSQINEFQMRISDFKMPELGTIGDLDMSKLNDLNLRGIEDLHPAEIGDLKSSGDLADISNIAGSLNGQVAGIQKVTKVNSSEIDAIGNLVESHVENLFGLNEVKDQAKALDEYKGLTEAIKNPDSLKEFAIEQTKEIAVDHFSGKEEQLSQAMETLAKYKSKYPNLNSIGEISRRPPNEMKGKPLIERIVPGIALQIQKKGDDFMIDLNPYVAYRFTARISGGVGWNQRVTYNFNHKKFDAVARIYGPRLFGEFKMWRGFSLRAEIEVMNTSIPPLTRNHAADPLHREWVCGAFAGIKKEYKLVKNIKGTASVMMRLYNPERKSPYADVVNTRFGFDFPIKKKRRAADNVH